MRVISLKNKLVLFGTGSSSERIHSLIDMKKNEVIGYVDNDIKKQGQQILHKPIWSPSILCNKKFDFVIICSIYFNEIYNQLIDMKIEKNKIINVYQEIRYNDVKLRLSEINKGVDMISTGMSYARYGIDNNSLNLNSINLAFNSQDIFYDYCLARFVLEEQKISIKYALISLSYFSFHFDLSRSKEKHLVTRYSLISETQRQVDYQKYNKFIKPNEESIPVLSFNLINDLFIDGFLHKFDFLKPCNKDPKKLQQGRKNLARIHSSKNFPDTVQENKDYLHNYIKLLLEKDIQPIFIIHPQPKDYREHFCSKMIYEFNTIINKFISQYNVKKIDLFSSDEFTNSDFFDLHHLNIEGAKKVSKIINRVLEI